MKKKLALVHTVNWYSKPGEFCTAQEMGGVSVTLMKTNEELKKYLDMAADSPGYIRH